MILFFREWSFDTYTTSDAWVVGMERFRWA